MTTMLLQPHEQGVNFSEAAAFHHMQSHIQRHGLTECAESRLAQMARTERERIQGTDPFRQ